MIYNLQHIKIILEIINITLIDFSNIKKITRRVKRNNFARLFQLFYISVVLKDYLHDENTLQVNAFRRWTQKAAGAI